MAASLLQLPLLGTRKAGCKWVGAAALAASHRLCFDRKASSIVSPSSIGLRGDAFGASSVATGPTLSVSPLDASDVVNPVTRSVSVVHAFLQLVLAHQTRARSLNARAPC
jgi:hypothetical protein